MTIHESSPINTRDMFLKLRAPIYSIIFLFLTGCSASKTPPPPGDPLMKINMPLQKFNHVVDRSFLNPAASLYYSATPRSLRVGANNIFYNIDSVKVFTNDVLQFDFEASIKTLGRFLINSTLGICGLFDIAEELGLPSHRNDFGKTLWSWGWKNSSYFIVPTLGPSTVRDAIGIVVDTFSNPVQFLVGTRDYNIYQYGYTVNKRSNFKSIEQVAGHASVNQYAFMRASFLQSRSFILNGGKNDMSAISDLEGPPE